MKIKTILVFLSIFILGFGSGFLLSGRLTRQSIEAARQRETPIGFKKYLYDYVKADSNQRQVIDSIVSEYIPKIKEESALSRSYQRHLRDSMFAEIQQLLNEKQKNELKKFEKEKIVKKPREETGIVKDTQDASLPLKYSRQNRKGESKTSLSKEQSDPSDSLRKRYKEEMRNPEMLKEIRRYTRFYILPVLTKERARFELELSEEEKATIASIRTKRKEIIKNEWMGVEEDPENGEKQKVLIQEAKKALKEIIVNHKTSIEQIAESLKPNRAKWEADMDMIKARYVKDYKPMPKDKTRKQLEKQVVEFILLDPDKVVGRGRRK